MDHLHFHDTSPPAPTDILIVEPIAVEVQQWLAARHVVRVAPEQRTLEEVYLELVGAEP